MSRFDELHSLQFAWFTTDESLTQRVDELFQSIFEVEPDQVQRLRPPAAPAMMTVASSATSEVEQKIQIVPGRLDVFFTPLDVSPQSPEAPKFASFDSFKDFLRISKKVCTQIKSSSRQSVIAKVAYKVKPKDFGIEFEKLLEIPGKLDGGSDFVFQMNKRIEVDSLHINRVLRWTSESVTLNQLQLSRPGRPMQHRIAQTNYITYLLDINTVPREQGRDGDEQVKVLDALAHALLAAVKVDKVSDIK